MFFLEIDNSNRNRRTLSYLICLFPNLLYFHKKKVCIIISSGIVVQHLEFMRDIVNKFFFIQFPSVRSRLCREVPVVPDLYDRTTGR